MDTIYIEFSKAIDNVSHKSMLKKHNAYGI